MKKVLCGLVIAIIMTGNGFAYNQKDKNCYYLSDNTHNLITEAHKRFSNELGNKKTPYELELIKQAHYFAVTYASYCKDWE